MTPNFSLSLSADGIRLLRRATGGWTLVGEVALDHPDLQGELGRLAEVAARLEPGGVRTKLLIPNDQIRYMALDTTRAEDADVRAALDGATPYAVSDLVYDYTKGGGRTYIAAVARETLDEAEAFLADLPFHPVCFAGVPEPFTFNGEVFFGQTKAAASVLRAGDTVERDPEPVAVIGVETLPEPEPLAVAELGPEPEPIPAPEAAPEPDDAPMAEDVPEQEDAPVEEDAPEAEPPAEEVVFASRAKPLVADRTMPPSPAKATPAPKTDAGEPMFASRARPDPAAPKVDGAGDGAPPLAVPGREATGPRLSIGAKDAPPAAPARPVRTDAPVSDTAPTVAPVAEGVAPPVSPAALAATMDPVEEAAEAPADPEPAGKPGLFRSRRKAGKRPAPAVPEEPEEEAERLTVFGARKRGKAGHVVGGKPKYLGLILTAILILFLLAVAALATVGTETIARWFGFGDAAVEVAATGAEGDLVAVPVAIPTPAEDFPNLPAPEEEALADVADAEDLLPPTGVAPEEDLAALDPELAAEPETAMAVEPSPVNPGILSPAEVQRRYEATGVWQRAPRLPLMPRVEGTDDVFLAAVDPHSPSADAIALPAIALSAPDPVIPFPVNPPPADAVFERDARGFILATTVGTRLPDGLIVYAGRPAVVPPARPDIAPTPGDDATEDPTTEEVALPEGPQVTPGGVSLAGLRPRPRPGDFSDSAERDTLGGFTRAELAGFRPRARPEDLAPPPPPADADAIAAALAGAIDPAAEATDLAVAVSVRPDARPRNFDRIVSAARSNPQPAPAAAAAPAPSASAFVAPNGPVPGGVARAATEDNVLRLRDINLIGVSGSSSNRTAIVRLSNGRIEVVRVGDRLDGGQVSAIGENALSYVKRGRTITLEMPRG
ncbi:hypothetical protein EU803_02580 [Loktanella sp. IMCC34160]|uniref:hypothetical protein n=1 Tax=Loktanella sp. IMCC34160 TaxID=2510646 RepID=UPI00101BB658|nr:hypothetical protein [Loktanella sp. IMCC34160]RYG93012.1 hypothetical protein EU803_02580 [Loktanella sp. IMCC34160]